MARQSKGSSFERDICRQLSVWWTGDPDTHDIFWRTSQSGGRATSRAKAGKKNKHHCGDIAAIDPKGSVLTKYVTFELKRGYNHADPIHLLDRPKHAAQQPFESFIEQAVSAAKRAGSRYWAIIHKRDRREPMIYVPYEMIDFGDRGGLMYLKARYRDANKQSWNVDVTAMPLSRFLKLISKKQFLIWVKR